MNYVWNNKIRKYIVVIPFDFIIVFKNFIHAILLHADSNHKIDFYTKMYI